MISLFVVVVVMLHVSRDVCAAVCLCRALLCDVLLTAPAAVMLCSAFFWQKAGEGQNRGSEVTDKGLLLCQGCWWLVGARWMVHMGLGAWRLEGTP